MCSQRVSADFRGRTPPLEFNLMRRAERYMRGMRGKGRGNLRGLKPRTFIMISRVHHRPCSLNRMKTSLKWLTIEKGHLLMVVDSYKQVRKSASFPGLSLLPCFTRPSFWVRGSRRGGPRERPEEVQASQNAGSACPFTPIQKRHLY